MQATPTSVPIKTATKVVVAVKVSDAANVTSINLLRQNPNGALAVVGTMNDRGEDGDRSPSDGVYSATLVLNEPVAGQVLVRATAAFKGLITRVLSDPLPISVEPRRFTIS